MLRKPGVSQCKKISVFIVHTYHRKSGDLFLRDCTFAQNILAGIQKIAKIFDHIQEP